MTPGLMLARVEDIAKHGAKVVDAGGMSLLITRDGDVVRAFINRCAHADYRLDDAIGHLTVQEHRYVVCHAHGASYTLEGVCAGGPCNGRGLTPVRIEVRDGVVVSA